MPTTTQLLLVVVLLSNMSLILLTLYCLFSPPSDWEMTDPKTPSKHVLVSFLDKSKSGFCPSLNLTHEKVTIPMQDYLAIVQKNCQIKKQTWRLLGTVETQSGKAQLVDIESPSAFGTLRILQAILRKKEDVFILTAGVLKKDFEKYAQKIQASFRSLFLCEDLLSLAKEDLILQETWQKKKMGIQSSAFEERVLTHKELGPVWQLFTSLL